jgi:hypothetical protein
MACSCSVLNASGYALCLPNHEHATSLRHCRHWQKRQIRAVPLQWITYRKGRRPAGVLIIEAPDLLQGRFRAGVFGLDEEADFAEGYEIDAEREAAVPKNMIGRMLSLDEAYRVIRRLENAITKTPPARSVRRGRRKGAQRTAS